MKISLAFIFTAVLCIIPLAYAEGGGGIECPPSSDQYTYILGSANYQTKSFADGKIGVLYCEYETESEDLEFEPFGEITAIFHVSGQLSQDLVDEYGCGAVLGEQYSPTYVSSDTHFASVAFSILPLANGAATIMAQIEEFNLASSCNIPEEKETTADIAKEAVKEHKVIEEKTIEVKKEEVGDIELPVKKPKIVLPSWIKNNAEWWAGDLISDSEFSQGIEYMIQNRYIIIPITESSSEPNEEIPDWVKNNAEWWSQNLISDEEFVNGLQFLISNGIIQVS